MTQNNQRQEPTFGEPSLNNPFVENAAAENATVENAPQAPKAKPNLSFSLHSKQSPGHTFTPVLKRPAELAQQFSTLEEQEMLKHHSPKTEGEPSNPQPSSAQPSNPQPSSVQPTVQPRNFVFTPAEPETAEPEPAAPAPSVLKAEPILAKPSAEKPVEPAKESTSTPSETMERVVPTVSVVAPKKNGLTAAVPPKYRRLLLVLLLALALVLAFFLLKPKTPQTVDDLQQGTSLPIEFRPVDEAEAKRAEEEAKALQAQAEAERQAQLQAEQAAQSVQPAQAVQSAPVQAVENPPVSANSAPSTPSAASAPIEPSKSEVKAESPKVEPKAEVSRVEAPKAETVKKPAVSGSVIYQPERAATKVERVERMEKAKPAPQPTAAKKVEAKAEPKVAEPAPSVQPSASSKVLTVKSGVTLFQNFRDNGLADNLPELNKMTKLNGKTSELKPGQKITLRLDAQKRIVEMNIGSGKYLRQADGSYIYK